MVTTPMFHSIYFPLYEIAKIHFSERFNAPTDSFKVVAYSSAMTGAFCNVVTNPFWLVKTRIQSEVYRIENISSHQEHHSRQYRSIFQSIWTIAWNEGPLALFNGLTASMMGISHVLIYFPLYERMKHEVRVRNRIPMDWPLPPSYIFMCAVLSKSFTSCITYPHEVIRAR